MESLNIVVQGLEYFPSHEHLLYWSEQDKVTKGWQEYADGVC